MFLYDADAERHRLHVYVGGPTSGSELLAGLRTILADPQFHPADPVLVDLRAMQRTPSIAELRDLAVAVRSSATVPGARRAIVTDSAVFYTVAELFVRLTSGAATTYRVFRSIAEAEAWLDEARPGDA